MEHIDKDEVNRKIGYLKHTLGKLENRMMKKQAERLDIKSQLIHLHKLKVTHLEGQE